MPGFDNNVVYANNVDFTGNSTVAAQMTTDGQLLIGSTTAPNIRVATLTSTDSSIAITNGHGTINLATPSSLIQTVKKTLTASDIRSLNGTPFVLVAAPGAKKIVVPISITAEFNYGGTNQFANGSNIIIKYVGGTSAISASLFLTADITGAVNLFSLNSTVPQNTGKAVGLIDNVGVILTSNGPEFTGNAADDNTIIVNFVYFISDLN